jgi:FkbM family methyltransferase
MNYSETLKSLTNRSNINLSDYCMAIFGAGNTSALYKKCFDFEQITPVNLKYFIDNSPHKQGTLFLGTEVISLEQFLSQQTDKPKLVLISSANIGFCSQIKTQLSAHHIDCFTVDEYIFGKRMNEILSVIDLLEDNFSKRVYVEMIIARMTNQPFAEDLYSQDQYFCLRPFLDRDPNEVFVDLGAYVGDTIEQYIQFKSGVFSKIFAFEPESRNMAALQYRVNRLYKEWALSEDRIIPVKAGVGKQSDTLSISNSHPDSPSLGANFLNTNGSSAEQIQIFSLDDYFANQNVSFIKADIESFELDMLMGAEKTILRDRPVLAISIYHSAMDMWRIPLWLQQTLPDYTFKIRQHSHLLLDTVLYAYPK